MPELLLEVGLEEIPARMIADAQAELARRVEALLGRQRLLEPVNTVTSYSTPRRLAVHVVGVLVPADSVAGASRVHDLRRVDHGAERDLEEAG